MDPEDTPTQLISQTEVSEALSAQTIMDSLPLSLLLGLRLGSVRGDESPPTNPDNYEIQERLGKGGMGTVYRARDLTLNREVAIKVLNNAAFATDEERRRFLSEAKAAGALKHDHIIPIWAYGAADESPWFVMPLLAGGSLLDLLKDQGALDAKQAVKVMITVCEAIQYAHDHHILHRDLKPANILLDGAGQPVVADFGLAKRLDSNSNLTASGVVMGTPSYMPPEQADGAKTSTLSDVYSLGALLYHLVTGRPPFESDSPMETLRQVKQEIPKRPTGIKPQIDRTLETIILKCLEKSPGDRYQSATALASELTRWQQNLKITTKQSSWPRQIVKWAKRKPAQALIAAVSTLGLLAFIASLIVSQIRLRAERDLTNTVRKNAEKLNGTALTDYRRTVEATVGKLDALEQITDSVGAYYAALPESLRDEAAQLRQAQLLLLSGEVNSDKGNLPQAKKFLDQARALTTPKIKSSGVDWKLVHAATLVKRADIALRQDDDAAAESFIEAAVTTARQIQEAAPGNIEGEQALGLALFYQGRTRTKKGGLPNVEAAANAFAESVRWTQAVAEQRPDNLRHQQEYVWSLVEHAKLNKNRGLGLLSDVEQLKTAVAKKKKTLTAAASTAEQNAKGTQSITEWEQQISATLARANPMLESAQSGYEQAATLLRALIVKFPWNYPMQRDLGVVRDGQGDLQFSWKKDLVAAEQAYTEYASLATSLVSHDSHNADWLRELATAKKNLASINFSKGQKEAALALFQEVVAVRRQLVAEDASNYKNARELCQLLIEQADTLTKSDRWTEALPILAECEKMCQDRAQQDGAEAWWENREISLWFRQALNQRNLGRSAARANPAQADFTYLTVAKSLLEKAAQRAQQLKQRDQLSPSGTRETEACAKYLADVNNSLTDPGKFEMAAPKVNRES